MWAGQKEKKRKESSHNGIQYREPWYVKKSLKNVFLYFIFLNNIFKIKPFFSWRNKTYRKSSSPVSLCIRASTRIRWLKQNERLSFWAWRPRANVVRRVMEHSVHMEQKINKWKREGATLGQVCDCGVFGYIHIFCKELHGLFCFVELWFSLLTPPLITRGGDESANTSDLSSINRDRQWPARQIHAGSHTQPKGGLELTPVKWAHGGGQKLIEWIAVCEWSELVMSLVWKYTVGAWSTNLERSASTYTHAHAYTLSATHMHTQTGARTRVSWDGEESLREQDAERSAQKVRSDEANVPDVELAKTKKQAFKFTEAISKNSPRCGGRGIKTHIHGHTHRRARTQSRQAWDGAWQREIMATSSSSSTRANRQNKHPSLKGHFLGLNFHERKSLNIFLYVYWHSRATNKRFRNFVSGNEEGKIKHVFAHRIKWAAGYPCNVFLKKQNKTKTAIISLLWTADGCSSVL